MTMTTEAMKQAQHLLRWTQFGECRAYPGPVKSAREVDKLLTEAIAAEETQGAELFGWAVSGCHGLFKGEHAEQDAKAEAKRCSGTAEAFALFTRPAPPADHIGDATKLSGERAALITQHRARAESAKLRGPNYSPCISADELLEFLDMLAADTLLEAKAWHRGRDAGIAEVARVNARQVAVQQEGVSLLPGKSSDISIEGLVILDKDMREWAQGHGLHLFYLGSWHVMQGKKWLTVGYESPLKALEACWEGSSLDDAPAAAPPPPNGVCDSPELCKLNGECAGPYGTKQKCIAAPQSPQADRVPMAVPAIYNAHATAQDQALSGISACVHFARAIEVHHNIGVKP